MSFSFLGCRSSWAGPPWKPRLWGRMRQAESRNYPPWYHFRITIHIFISKATACISATNHSWKQVWHPPLRFFLEKRSRLYSKLKHFYNLYLYFIIYTHLSFCLQHFSGEIFKKKGASIFSKKFRRYFPPSCIKGQTLINASKTLASGHWPSGLSTVTKRKEWIWCFQAEARTSALQNSLRFQSQMKQRKFRDIFGNQRRQRKRALRNNPPTHQSVFSLVHHTKQLSKLYKSSTLIF